MARPKRPKNPLAVSDAKNAVRGALDNKQADVFEVLSTSLHKISVGDISIFADWVERFPAKRKRIYPPRKITSYQDLRLQSFTVIRDLQKSIRWVTTFLANHLPIIRVFLDQLEVYENAVLSGNYERAASILQNIENEIGLSVWLVEARIALYQRLHGLEEQKKYAQYVHDQIRGSIPGFVAHYISQRNEDSTSYERFVTRARNEIYRQPVSKDIQLYLENRLIGKHQCIAEEEGACASLWVSSAFSLVDAYEALVDTLQAVLEFPQYQNCLSTAKQSVCELDVKDWRLTKIRAVLTGEYGQLPFHPTKGDDALSRGKFESAIGVSLEHALECPVDMDALVVAATGHALGDREMKETPLSGIQNELLAHLTTLASKRGPVAKAANELAKLGQNLRSIRVAGTIQGRLELEWFESADSRMSKGAAIFYSSALWNPTHWFVLQRDQAAALLAHCRQDNEGSLATSIAMDQSVGRPIQVTLPVEIERELSATSALYHGDIALALDCARALSESHHKQWRRLAAKLEVKCLLLNGQRDAAIRRTVEYCCAVEELRFVLPLRAILAGIRWHDVQHLVANIELPIIFDLFWRTVDEAEHETNRRNAYAEFLKAHSCPRPSNLKLQIGSFDRTQLIYFLRYVCTPEVMDVSFDAFASSREIQDQRIEICSWLSVLDEPHAGVYSDELQGIKNFLTIQDGLRDVDSSRVHVNVEAVGRWAEKELKESFTRYKDLLKARVGFGTPEAFTKVVQAFLDGKPSGVDQFLQYPDIEGGDRLLIELFESIAKEFLSNPDYGLDAFLSMRIRHGSLAGRMRGPLEERNLIVTKSGTLLKYQDNSVLADRLSVIPESSRACLFQAFRRFSESYDEIIESLTATRLQIRRPEKPEGMFSLDLTANPLIALFVRSQIQENTSFEDFLVYVFTAIDTLLEQKLLLVRIFISSTVKLEVERAFEILRHSLEADTTPSEYGRLNSAIAAVIPEVQAAISQIAEWFGPTRKQHQLVLLTIEQMIEIGIETTKLAHKGFTPVIERHIEYALQPMAVLSEFTDILYTIFSNVYFHSGNKVSPWINLKSSTHNLDSEDQILNLRVESEVTPDVYSESCEARLEAIRQQLVSGAYRTDMNLEGGTGLKKLRRTLSGDPRQTLDFGFVDGKLFFVAVGIILTSLPPEATELLRTSAPV